MEHICDKKKELSWIGDIVQFNEHAEHWKLYLDCHCCSTDIDFCPYCGMKLEAPAK